MTIVASALVAWALLSIASAPVLVVCVRAQQRANARRTARLHREGWFHSAR
jgi:hypothetical protein